jgi:hypothetical protein
LAAVKTYYSDDAIVIVFWKNLVITHVRGDMSVQRMVRLGESYAVLLREHPRGVAGLGILEAGTPVASSEARQESARFLGQLGDKVLHVAFAIETQGVTGMMLRSVVRGLNVLMKRTRMSLHNNVEAAVQHTLPFVPVAGSNTDALKRELMRVIATLRHERAALSA